MKIGDVRRENQDLQTRVNRISDSSGNRLRISISKSTGKMNLFDDDDSLEAFVGCELEGHRSILIDHIKNRKNPNFGTCMNLGVLRDRGNKIGRAHV